ncbi:hypothetical protein C7Y47_24020 [Lysinibacillus sphaericus]|uniref:Transglycosylase n=1 Tax=Lysinibacillus sphaericus TaxID=1421 RepID=A0A544U7G6_LYSSH|nr:hypothetical protein [Lysinibacillus sp. SDF0037]TQR26856.1 hypothetical protein C7Y47_24020 [Lysinibacillus sp. SDF0037]
MKSEIVCDDCQTQITINLQEYEHPAHKFKGYVVETYFKCPHCQKKYIAFVTDKKARMMQKEIRQYHQSIIKRDYSGLTEEEYKAEIDKQYAVLNGMKQKLKVRMDELKAQVLEIQ